MHGISLPFFSYGGTALLIQMAEAGIILSISRELPGAPPRRGREPPGPRVEEKTRKTEREA